MKKQDTLFEKIYLYILLKAKITLKYTKLLFGHYKNNQMKYGNKKHHTKF